MTIEVGRSGGVKSVQRGIGTITSSATLNVTVSAVDMDKSLLSVVGPVTSAVDSVVYEAYGELTSSTNLRFTRGTNNPQGSFVSWELVEYV